MLESRDISAAINIDGVRLTKADQMRRDYAIAKSRQQTSATTEADDDAVLEAEMAARRAQAAATTNGNSQAEAAPFYPPFPDDDQGAEQEKDYAGFTNPMREMAAAAEADEDAALEAEMAARKAQQQAVSEGPGVGDTVGAKFKFEASEDDELSFAVGDKITLLNAEGNWWTGRNEATGEEGNFPNNYVAAL